MVSPVCRLSVCWLWLLAIVTFVQCGDDDVWEYPSFTEPQWIQAQRASRFRFGSREKEKGVPAGQYRRYGQIHNVGPQPPFVLYGTNGILPTCVESATGTYCTDDTEYPIELMTSCILENVPSLKAIRARAQWSCEEFPDHLLPAEEPTSTTLPESETEPAAETEVLQPVKAAPAQKPARPAVRERLIQPAASARSPTRPLVRRVRDSEPVTWGPARLLFPSVNVNHTYEVCPSTVKNAVGIVRAQASNGEWMPLVQMGNCKQIIRTEECVSMDAKGEPPSTPYFCFPRRPARCEKHRLGVDGFPHERKLRCDTDCPLRPRTRPPRLLRPWNPLSFKSMRYGAMEPDFPEELCTEWSFFPYCNRTSPFQGCLPAGLSIVTQTWIRAGEPCEHLCSHLKSQCSQRYGLQQLLTCTADRGLYLEWFRVPTSCGCQVEFSGTGTTTPDPNSDRR